MTKPKAWYEFWTKQQNSGWALLLVWSGNNGSNEGSLTGYGKTKDEARLEVKYKARAAVKSL